MEVEIINRNSKSITVQVEIPLKAGMLDAEEAIQESINQAVNGYVTDYITDKKAKPS